MADSKTPKKAVHFVKSLLNERSWSLSSLTLFTRASVGVALGVVGGASGVGSVVLRIRSTFRIDSYSVSL